MSRKRRPAPARAALRPRLRDSRSVLDASGRPLAELLRDAAKVRALTWFIAEEAEAAALPALIKAIRAADKTYPGVQLVAYGPGLRPREMSAIADAGGVYHGPDAFGRKRPRSGAELAAAVAVDFGPPRRAAKALPAAARRDGAARSTAAPRDVTTDQERQVFDGLIADLRGNR